MDFDQSIAQIQRNLAAANDLMSQLASVQVHQAAQLVSHEKLLKFQEQNREQDARWRAQQEQWKAEKEQRTRELERFAVLHEQRLAEHEQRMAELERFAVLHEQRMAEIERVLARSGERVAEIGDKLDGLIGFMNGYFRKE